MGTRGLFGFVVNGKQHLAYSHSDSYPSHLGTNVLTFLKEALARAGGLTAMQLAASMLEPIDEDKEPTPEQIARCAPYTNLAVSRQSTSDWYCLLRGAQGSPEAMLRAGLYEDSSTFALDSLFCEWGYVIDLDAKVFEVYEGFQTEPHESGRFRGELNKDGYAPIKLARSYPFAELPDDLDGLEEELYEQKEAAAVERIGGAS